LARQIVSEARHSKPQEHQNGPQAKTLDEIRDRNLEIRHARHALGAQGPEFEGDIETGKTPRQLILRTESMRPTENKTAFGRSLFWS
tara:strand:- start:236 stop:496 length:261 start_codon:yes stop_codon:yes gene_type:complete